MITIDVNINSAKSAKDYVEFCEKEFEKMLADAVGTVISPVAPKIITVSGPTCSGKTTTSAKLTDLLERNGYGARVLSIDDFYRDNIRSEENPDFESAAAIDLEYFGECVEKLFCGKKVYLPTFDMKTGVRAALTEYLPSPDDIFIFEGIQAVYPEVTSVLKPFGYKSVFINVADGAVANGVLFSKEDIRFFRRIVRDEKFRATDAYRTFRLWEDVRKNEESNILPYSANFDCKINSFLPYELFVIGKYLIPALESVPMLEYLPRADEITNKIKKVTNEYITENMIPFGSVFREFIG